MRDDIPSESYAVKMFQKSEENNPKTVLGRVPERIWTKCK